MNESLTISKQRHFIIRLNQKGTEVDSYNSRLALKQTLKYAAAYHNM